MDLFDSVLGKNEGIIKGYKPNCKRFMLVHILLLTVLSIIWGSVAIFVMYGIFIVYLKTISPSELNYFLVHNGFIIPIIILIGLTGITFYVHITYRNTSYGITNRRVINRTWIFQAKYRYFTLSSIKSVTTNSSLVDKWLHKQTGNIIFNFRLNAGYKTDSYNASLNKRGYVFEGIDNAEKVMDEIKATIEEYKN